MSKKPRSFSPETKLAIVKRILSGEEVSALAREMKVSRTHLYRWKDRYRKGGAAAFHVRRGPKPKAGAVGQHTKSAADLDGARRRIAELERKIGQQQLELDFFQKE